MNFPGGSRGAIDEIQCSGYGLLYVARVCAAWATEATKPDAFSQQLISTEVSLNVVSLWSERRYDTRRTGVMHGKNLTALSWYSGNRIAIEEFGPC